LWVRLLGDKEAENCSKANSLCAVADGTSPSYPRLNDSVGQASRKGEEGQAGNISFCFCDRHINRPCGSAKVTLRKLGHGRNK